MILLPFGNCYCSYCGSYLFFQDTIISVDLYIYSLYFSTIHITIVRFEPEPCFPTQGAGSLGLVGPAGEQSPEVAELEDGELEAETSLVADNGGHETP